MPRKGIKFRFGIAYGILGLLALAIIPLTYAGLSGKWHHTKNTSIHVVPKEAQCSARVAIQNCADYEVYRERLGEPQQSQIDNAQGVVCFTWQDQQKGQATQFCTKLKV